MFKKNKIMITSENLVILENKTLDLETRFNTLIEDYIQKAQDIPLIKEGLNTNVSVLTADLRYLKEHLDMVHDELKVSKKQFDDELNGLVKKVASLTSSKSGQVQVLVEQHKQKLLRLEKGLKVLDNQINKLTNPQIKPVISIKPIDQPKQIIISPKVVKKKAPVRNISNKTSISESEKQKLKQYATDMAALLAKK